MSSSVFEAWTRYSIKISILPSSHCIYQKDITWNLFTSFSSASTFCERSNMGPLISSDEAQRAKRWEKKKLLNSTAGLFPIVGPCFASSEEINNPYRVRVGCTEADKESVKRCKLRHIHLIHWLNEHRGVVIAVQHCHEYLHDRHMRKKTVVERNSWTF